MIRTDLEKPGEELRVVGLELCLEIESDDAVFQGEDGDLQPSQPTSHSPWALSFTWCAKRRASH